ncbi:hypothetical protein, partial [Klebsiella pneumoniae]|uniref:hypothetical protein n=1 Tax=Klebsiella pneumoniae TaxID=573 RepID=UPI003B5B3150
RGFLASGSLEETIVKGLTQQVAHQEETGLEVHPALPKHRLPGILQVQQSGVAQHGGKPLAFLAQKALRPVQGGKGL